MDFTEILGLTAGALTTSALVPQLTKLLRTKRSNDVSLTMFIVMIVGIVLWLIYGLIKHDPSIIIANSVSLFLALTILILKIRYHRPD